MWRSSKDASTEIEGKCIGEDSHPKFDNKVCHFCAGSITFLREDNTSIPYAGSNCPIIASKEQDQNRLPYNRFIGYQFNSKEAKELLYRGRRAMMKEHADPIVAFSKPPPFPPVLGPLVVLSLFQAWTSRDSDD